MTEIRSKYQRKTMEEYELTDEFNCRKCDGWFIFSYSRCKEIVDDNGEERFIVYCPYCKMEHRVHV